MEITNRHGRRGQLGVRPIGRGDAIRMSQLTASPESAEKAQLSRLCVAIRGKLQFMDYLVRAAVADAERYQDENTPGAPTEHAAPWRAAL